MSGYPSEAIMERERLASLAIAISHILTTHQPLDLILQRCTETIVSHLDVALTRIWLLDGSSETLFLRASAGLSTNLHGRYSTIAVATSLNIGRIVEDRQSRFTNRLQEEEWLNEPEWAKREGLVAYAAFPLIAQGRVIGVMAMFSRGELGSRMLDEFEAIIGGIAQCIVRSQAEDALRANEERLALAVESAGMAMWDWNLVTGQMVWSGELFDLLGYQTDAILPTFDNWKAQVYPEDLPKVVHELEQSHQTHSRYLSDYRILRHGTGEIVWVAARGHYLYDDSQTPIRMIGGLFNINHRKQSEAQIQRLLEEARRHEQELRAKQAQLVQAAKLASIGELATGLAHELNNPLNNIALFVGNAVDLINEGRTRPEDRLLANLQAAAEQVRRAGSIINHLRIFGRKGSELYQPVHVHPILDSALEFIGERLRMGQVDTKCILSPGNPMIQGCPVQLEQVFVNLLANALDAMKESRTKVIRIGTAVEHGSVCITIADTGTGIPADILPRIFDPFFTTKEVGLGTGLGLSISYGILKEHHGDITVQSAVGQGTEFVIHLPLSQ